MRAAIEKGCRQMKWTRAALTVLLIHTAAAQAQQSQYPPGYGPPPGYVPPPGYGPPPGYVPPRYAPPPPPPPPPGYYYYNPAPPPPPPRRNILYRPFTIGGGIGFGGLRLHDAHDGGTTTSEGGFAYTAHLGFGLASRLILMWDVEGSVVSRNASFFSQTANLAALQLFVGDRLFIKGGFGVAQVRQDDFYSAWGGAGMMGIGYELIQGWHWSFDIEATVTGATYRNQTKETWTNWSLVNFALNFF
jgi:hypothetical protein